MTPAEHAAAARDAAKEAGGALVDAIVARHRAEDRFEEAHAAMQQSHRDEGAARSRFDRAVNVAVAAAMAEDAAQPGEEAA